MKKTLLKYKEKCREFWGACLMAGPETGEEVKDRAKEPPESLMEQIVATAVLVLVTIGLLYLAVLGTRHLWVNIIQPMLLGNEAAGL